jgi:hypothetical protein
VKNVADDRDLQSGDTSFVLAYCQRVEQRLRRMLVSAVSRIDYCRCDNARNLVWCSRRGMPDDDRVGAMASRLSAVSTRVSPLTTLDVDVDILTASAERRLAAISKLVASASRPRRRVDDSLPAKRRHFLDKALIDVTKRLGGVEDQRYLLDA